MFCIRRTERGSDPFILYEKKKAGMVYLYVFPLLSSQSRELCTDYRTKEKETYIRPKRHLKICIRPLFTVNLGILSSTTLSFQKGKRITGKRRSRWNNLISFSYTTITMPLMYIFFSSSRNYFFCSSNVT